MCSPGEYIIFRRMLRAYKIRSPKSASAVFGLQVNLRFRLEALAFGFYLAARLPGRFCVSYYDVLQGAVAYFVVIPAAMHAAVDILMTDVF